MDLNKTKTNQSGNTDSNSSLFGGGLLTDAIGRDDRSEDYNVLMKTSEKGFFDKRSPSGESLIPRDIVDSDTSNGRTMTVEQGKKPNKQQRRRYRRRQAAKQLKQQQATLTPAIVDSGTFQPLKKKVSVTLTPSQEQKKVGGTKRLRSEGSTPSNTSNVSKRPRAALQTPSFAQASKPVKMAIVKETFPYIKLVKEEVDKIQLAILQKIDAIPVGDPLPTLHGNVLANGALTFSCGDTSSVEWLTKEFHNNAEILDEVALKVIYAKNLLKPVRVSFRTKDIITKHSKVLTDRISRFNPALQATEWRFLHKIDEGPTTRWIFQVELEILEAIKEANFGAYTGLDWGTFYIIRNFNEPNTKQKKDARKGYPTPTSSQTMLHSENPFVMSALLPTPDVNNTQVQMTAAGINDGPPAFAPGIPLVSSSPVTQHTTTTSQRPSNQIPGRPSLLGDRPITNNSGPPNQFPDHGMNSRSHGDEDLRQIPAPDRDMRAPPPGLMGGDQDMRHLPVDKDFRSMTGPPRSLDSRFPNIPPSMQNMPHGDIRSMSSGDMRNMPPGDMRGLQNLPSSDMRNLPLGDMHARGPNDGLSQPRGMPPMNSLNAPPGGRAMAPGDTRNIPLGSGRNMPPIDSRGMPLGDANNRGPMFERPRPGGNFDGPVPSRIDDHRPSGAMNSSVRPLQNPRITAVGSNSPAMGGASPNPAPSPRSNAAFATAAAIAPHDQEKATLIMQVLQLSDQQIAILPPEQRQSILILKEQIARSTQAS